IRNTKPNQYLSTRDSWNLGKSAAAIRTIVNCLRDRSPTVATTPPPAPTEPPPGTPPPSQKGERVSCPHQALPHRPRGPHLSVTARMLLIGESRFGVSCDFKRV